MKVMTLFIFTTISMFLGAQTQTHNHKHASDDHIAGLILNDGHKWEMAPHMAKLINEMEHVLASSDHKSLSGLRSAGNQMKDLITKLVSGCSMVGPAHDNLHAFLSVYIPTVQQLVDVTNLEEADQVAKKLKVYFNAYNTHFE